MGKWHKTSCVLCPISCGLEVLVEDNRITAFAPGALILMFCTWSLESKVKQFTPLEYILRKSDAATIGELLIISEVWEPAEIAFSNSATLFASKPHPCFAMNFKTGGKLLLFSAKKILSGFREACSWFILDIILSRSNKKKGVSNAAV